MPRQDTSEHALPEGCAQGPEQVPIARRLLDRTTDTGRQGKVHSGAHEARATVQGARVEKVKAINAELRRLTYELKRDGLIP